MKTIEFIKQIDVSIFKLINQTFAYENLDGIMTVLRNPNTWIPMYAIILIYIFKKFPTLFIPFLVSTLCCFAITDFVSASIIKPFVARLRPCHNTAIGYVRSIVSCGGLYSMPSSHASNHFGLASCWFSIFYFLHKKRFFILFVWAALICYAQIYVGVHYPTDIAVGALFGFFIGWLSSTIFIKWAKWLNQIDKRKMATS